MNPKTIIFAVVALAITGATFFIVRGWMNSQRDQVRVVKEQQKKTPEPPKTQILLAVKALPAGHLVKPNDLAWQAWPAEGVGSMYVVKGKGNINDFIGTVVRSGIAAGEPITQGRLVKPGERGFMAAVLKPGWRAVSVPLNAITGIAGFVFPGDRVDLILTHNVKDSGIGNARVSQTMLTNIRVLAIDQLTDDLNGKPRVAKTATFEVMPRQAELIAVAAQLGKLSLSLRSLASSEEGGDGAVDTRRGRTYTSDHDISELLGDRGPRNRPKKVVNILRGAKAETESFDATTHTGTANGPGRRLAEDVAGATEDADAAAMRSVGGSFGGR